MCHISDISEELYWFRGWSYCELQSFIEQAVALAVEECIGASRLGYSYPGQAGFLQRARDHRNHLLVSAYTTS